MFSLLSGGPWSPFENNWHLREEFKRSNKRTELSQKLSRQIAWLAIANFLLCPLIFLWQLMYFFFNYADVSILFIYIFSISIYIIYLYIFQLTIIAN